MYSPLPGEDCGPVPPAGNAGGTRGHHGRCLEHHTKGVPSTSGSVPVKRGRWRWDTLAVESDFTGVLAFQMSQKRQEARVGQRWEQVDSSGALGALGVSAGGGTELAFGGERLLQAGEGAVGWAAQAETQL